MAGAETPPESGAEIARAVRGDGFFQPTAKIGRAFGAEDPGNLGALQPGIRSLSISSRAGRRASHRRDPTALGARSGIARARSAPRRVRLFPAPKIRLRQRSGSPPAHNLRTRRAPVRW